MATLNLVIRFLAELAGVVAVGYAGFAIAGPLPVRTVAGVGAALALAVVWGLVAAPKASNGLSQPQKDVIGTALLLVAAGALAVAGQPSLAIGFAAVILANAALLFVFPDAREHLVGMAR